MDTNHLRVSMDTLPRQITTFFTTIKMTYLSSHTTLQRLWSPVSQTLWFISLNYIHDRSHHILHRRDNNNFTRPSTISCSVCQFCTHWCTIFAKNSSWQPLRPRRSHDQPRPTRRAWNESQSKYHQIHSYWSWHWWGKHTNTSIITYHIKKICRPSTKHHTTTHSTQARYPGRHSIW